MTLVKICGITREEDALDAIELGADFLGFNFYPDSPRYLKPDLAYQLLMNLPRNIPKVGVFVNEKISKVIDLAIELELDILQFHGDEKASELNELGRDWFKAFRIRSEEDLAEIPQYECDSILLDAYSAKAYGGTGHTTNWDVVRKAKKFGKKIILAGGLTPDNVELAIASVNPFMLDVASGVEESPGIKSRDKMAAFISRAHQAK